jgi:hypothetical protein
VIFSHENGKSDWLFRLSLGFAITYRGCSSRTAASRSPPPPSSRIAPRRQATSSGEQCFSITNTSPLLHLHPPPLLSPHARVLRRWRATHWHSPCRAPRARCLSPCCSSCRYQLPPLAPQPAPPSMKPEWAFFWRWLVSAAGRGCRRRQRTEDTPSCVCD